MPRLARQICTLSMILMLGFAGPLMAGSKDKADKGKEKAEDVEYVAADEKDVKKPDEATDEEVVAELERRGYRCRQRKSLGSNMINTECMTEEQRQRERDISREKLASEQANAARSMVRQRSPN